MREMNPLILRFSLEGCSRRTEKVMSRSLVKSKIYFLRNAGQRRKERKSEKSWKKQKNPGGTCN